jgi:EAL domain-containing protein (putative c-di-GMP-specific phosphodiesterase class I)/GGDEF domain-containing protein
VVTIAVGDYRAVTESFGHRASQELIASAASRLRQVAPPDAALAQIADDTFAILLTGRAIEDVRATCQELLERFASTFRVGDTRLSTHGSAGLAFQSPQGPHFRSAERLIQASYSAMCRSRREGGNTLNVASPPYTQESLPLYRRERLRRAVRDGELALHYQPVVSLVTGATLGAEALIRWDHPERGLLRPGAFLPAAEGTDVADEIDRWVFETALRNAQSWVRPGASPVDWVSVNVSPGSLERGFQDWCLRHVREASLPEGALHLEITEQSALQDVSSLQPLRRAGLKLAIDDFGTGYSSLNVLRSLDADVLKIDQTFVDAVGSDPKTTAIVQFLLNLSLRLDLEVIAEGVTEAEHADTLRELGCSMGQGYHFSRPVPEATLLEQAASLEDR